MKALEFSRRVRSLGEVANANMGAQTRDDMNREQFIDGIYDAELLLRQEFEGFTQAVARAQFLELVNKTARARSRRRPNYVQELQSVPDLTETV